MIFRLNADLCARMGLNGSQQVRWDSIYKNLWWTFEGSNVIFGYGDLNIDDCRKIQQYLSHPSHETDIVFLGWDEYHPTSKRQGEYPRIRITKDDITYPLSEAREKIMKVVR